MPAAPQNARQLLSGHLRWEPKVLLAKKLHADKSLEIDDVCQLLRISRSTFYRYVRLE